MNWTSFFSGLQSLGTSVAQDVALTSGPQAVAGAPGVIYNPATGQLLNTNSLTSGSGGILILLLLGVVLIFALRK